MKRTPRNWKVGAGKSMIGEGRLRKREEELDKHRTRQSLSRISRIDGKNVLCAAAEKKGFTGWAA